MPKKLKYQYSVSVSFLEKKSEKTSKSKPAKPAKPAKKKYYLNR